MSWQDLERIIVNPIFASLKNYFSSKKLSINKFGPLMGAANIRKLSNSCVMSILSSDFVLIKGCRVHEMLQGGLNVDTFSCYVVCRNLSEIVSGFSSSNNPLLLIHLRKNEFSFFGINKENCKKNKLKDKKIKCCMSTLSDHQKRKKLSSHEEIVAKYRFLLKQADKYIGDKEYKRIVRRYHEMKKQSKDRASNSIGSDISNFDLIPVIINGSHYYRVHFVE